MLSFFSLVPFRAWLIIGAVAAALTFTGIVYGKGYAAAKHAVEVANLQAQTKYLRETLAQRQEAYAHLAEETAKDAAVIMDLNERVEKATAELEDAERQCLTEKDTDKLKELWK